MGSFKKFLLFLLINLLVHLPFMQLPPSGTHVWRQCNTLAMSRNFAEEGMNILEPKIDRRNETNGITGSHFPLYEWLLAALSKPFGFSDLLARIFSLVIFSFTMFAFYLLLLHFKIPEKIATIGSLLLLSIPELYYHSINAMPDNLALCLALLALLFWLRILQKPGFALTLTAILLSTLCGLIKFQFLMIPLSAMVLIPFKWRSLLKYAGIWTCIALVVYAWYDYALTLTQSNNLREYGLWIKPVALETKLNTLFGNLTMDVPEVLMGWFLLAALLVAVIKGLKVQRWSAPLKFASAWLVMFGVFYWTAIERMQQHAYYFMPLLPLFVFVLILLWHKLEFRFNTLIVMLVLNFSWALIRIIPSRWVEGKRQIPVEFSDPALRAEFSKAIPPNSKCVVGPDLSGCIFFYFTHTKGYSFEETKELTTVKENRQDIENMRAAGVKFLIIKDGSLLKPFMDTLHLKQQVKTIGTFEIWEL